MRTDPPNNPTPPDEFSASTWERKLNSSLPKTLSNREYDIEGRIARPRASIEIRHFHPQEPQVPNPVTMEVCYLSLALSPRPADMQVNYLGGNNPKYFTTFGNCCFVPAGQESYVRGSVGQYREICCLFDLSLFEPHVDC